MASVNIKVNLITKAAKLQLGKLNSLLKSTGTTVENMGKRGTSSMATLSRSFRNASIAFGSFGILLRAGAVGGGLFALGKAVQKIVKDFSAFEVALVGVGKTTNLAGNELELFGSEIQKLSRVIPLPTNELLRLSQVAAQLGVRGSNNLKQFAEVGARLSVTTNLSAEEAVTSLTKIIGVTGESIDQVSNLGSALTVAGNEFKAFEDEILTAANRVARSTAQFNVTAVDTLAIATALKEAGVEAESGGTAVGRVLREIAKAAGEGGDRFEEFRKITGLTADDLKKKLQTDGGEAFKAFINGLSSSNLSAIQLTSTLAKLGLNTDRVIATVTPLVKINERVNDSFQRLRDGAKDNTALFEESNRVFDTVSSGLNTLNNAFRDIFVNLGKAQSGTLKNILDSLIELTTNIANATDPISNYDKKIVELRRTLNGLEAELNGLTLQFGSGPGGIIKSYFAALSDGKRSIGEVEVDIARARQELEKFNKLGFVGPTKPTKKSEKDTSQDDKKRDQEKIDRINSREETIAGLLQTFREADNLAIQQKFDSDLLFEDIKNEQSFKILEKQLGREEALKETNRALELKNQGKHKEAVLSLNRAFDKADLERQRTQRDAEISGRQTLDSSIITLTQSKNKTLKTIGKAAALTQLAIKTPEAIGNSFTFGTSIGGPVVGAVFAGIAAAAMAEQVARLTSVGGFKDGGIVPGSSFSGDQVTARVNSGEMILNRSQQAELFNLATGRGQGQNNPIQINNTTTLELDGRELARAVSKEVAAGVTLGEFE